MNISAIVEAWNVKREKVPLVFMAIGAFFFLGFGYWIYTEFSTHRALEEVNLDITLRSHLQRIEQATELDLSRMAPHEKIILRAKVLKFFLENSAVRNLFSLKSGTYEHYFYTNESQRLYGRSRVSDWKEVPEGVRDQLVKRPEDLKIFIGGNKIYFGKGRRISNQVSFHLLISQPLSEFCKEYGIKPRKLFVNDTTYDGETPVFISQAALVMAAQNAIRKSALQHYYEVRSHALSFWILLFLLIAALAVFSFRKIVRRMRLCFDNRLRSEVEFLSENYSDIHQDVQNAHEEIQLLKHNVFLSRISDEARLKVLEKIFPSYPAIMSNVQKLQAGMITGRLDEKMDDIVLGFKESIELVGTKNREVTLSLKSLIEEIREIFLGEFSKNKIQFNMEGEDGIIEGPISNMYFIFYFLFKKIAMHLPPNGQIHIDLHGDSKIPYVVISDNGLSLSPIEKERLTTLMNPSSDLVKDPTEEEFQLALDYLGWKREVAGTSDNKTITTLRFSSSGEKTKCTPRTRTQPENDGASNIVCITTKKPL